MKSLGVVFLLLLVGCTGCAHTSNAAAETPLPPTPPTFGFNALVRPDRKIVCLIDETFGHAQCQEVVRAAAKINAAVGFELLAVPVEMPLVSAKDSTADDEVTYVNADDLDEGVLGVTFTKEYEIRGGFLRRVLILYSPLIWASQELRESVVLHELIHSIGGVHAGQASAFNSVEKPGWAPGAPVDLTPGDLAALRAAYPAPR